MTSTLTAVAAHELSGGSTTPAAALALLLGSSAVAATITGRRVSTSQLLGLLVLTQAVVHLMCAVDDPAVGGWSMLGGHLVATGLSAALLMRGERWAWQLYDALKARVVRRPGVTPVPSADSVPIGCHDQRAVGIAAQRFVSVRGPPVRV